MIMAILQSAGPVRALGGQAAIGSGCIPARCSAPPPATTESAPEGADAAVSRPGQC